ncbi:MAG: PD-(D/E)XK nuclease family protein [Thermodesulfobacteriota bacterium]|nr:PD-(D/E)XK nuclease family protein [Thermodesulfobacteriota bacterium]
MVKIEKRILSPTAINTYLSCPRKFYLRYIRRLQTKPSIHLVRGRIVHKAIHEFHINYPKTAPQVSLTKIRQDLLNTFHREWIGAAGSLNSLGLTRQEIDFYRDDSELMIFNFSQWFYRNNLASPDLSETKIVSKTLGLMGIIDAVHTWDDKVALVDYKTSKYANITDDILRQAALYALLYQDKYNEVPESILIHFVKFPDDPAPIRVDDELLDYARTLIKSVREKTVSHDEQDYPCTCGGYCKRDFVMT